MPEVRFSAPYKISEADRAVLKRYLSRMMELTATVDGFAVTWGGAVSIEYGSEESMALLEWAARLAEHHKERLLAMKVAGG